MMILMQMAFPNRVNAPANDAPVITAITANKTVDVYSVTFTFSDTEGNLPNYQIPIAKAVRVPSTINSGSLQTAEYIYEQGNGIAEGTSTFVWQTATDAAFTTGLTTVATTLTYTPSVGDVGKYLRFGVVPVTSVGLSGAQVFSDGTVVAVAFNMFTDIAWNSAFDLATASADLALSKWTNQGTDNDAGIGAIALPTWNVTEGRVEFTRASTQSLKILAAGGYTAPLEVWVRFKLKTITGVQGLVGLSNTHRLAVNSSGFLVISGNATTVSIVAGTEYVIRWVINGASSSYQVNNGAEVAISLSTTSIGTPSVRLGCEFGDANYLNGYAQYFLNDVLLSPSRILDVWNWFGF